MPKFTIKLLILLAMLSISPLLNAIELGGLHVKSSLGEPLNAEIVLNDIDDSQLARLSASIGNKEQYAALGLYKLAVYDQIQLEIQAGVDSSIIKLSSVEPIKEPFLNLIIQLTSHQSELVKEYALLLEKNVNLQNQISNAVVESSQSISHEEVVTEDIAGNSSKASEDNNHEYEVMQGDTLIAIVKKLGYAADINRALLAFYQLNQNVLGTNNIHYLLAGTKLKLPTQMQVQSFQEQDVTEFIKEQGEAWQLLQEQYGLKNKPDASATDDELNQTSSGKLVAEQNGSISAKSETNQQGKDIIKLTKASDQASVENLQERLNAMQDEITTHENSIQETNRKTQALEQQILEMQHLLMMKNQIIQQLQEASSDLNEHQTLWKSILQKWMPVLIFILIACLIFVLYHVRSQQKREHNRLMAMLNKSKTTDSKLSQTNLNQGQESQEKVSESAAFKNPQSEPLHASDDNATLGEEALGAKTLDLIKNIDFNLSSESSMSSISTNNKPAPSNELNLSEMSLDFNPKPFSLKQVNAEQKTTKKSISRDLEAQVLKQNIGKAKAPNKKSETEKLAKTSKTKQVNKEYQIADIKMQLDLAAAYVDIGDKKNARKLLKQILRDGDEPQKHKAEEIMLLIR